MSILSDLGKLMTDLKNQDYPDEIIGEEASIFLETEQELKAMREKEADNRYWNGLNPDNPNDDL